MNLWPLGIGGGGTGTGEVVQVPVSGTFSDTIEHVRFMSIVTDYTYGTSIASDSLKVELASDNVISATVSDVGLGITVSDDIMSITLEDTQIDKTVNIDSVSTDIKCHKED